MGPRTFVCGLLALLSLSSPAPDREHLPLPEARVEARRGRFLATEGAEVISLSPGSGARPVRAPLHVEGGTRSELEITWRGIASVRVHGSMSLAIRPDTEPPLDPEVRISFLASADVEVRRGALELLLPHGWTLTVERGAIHVRELPDGSLEVIHHGGRPVGIASRIDPEGDHPETLSSGGRLRLAAPAYPGAGGASPSPWM